ncbi:acyl-CoA thioesterase II [Nocardioides gansuensis]|uniref:Acyl-CoA thioesterase 2 n=1 Tax=Nocardioides gansuensis TaxID=2138300 RepID=A0A2T8FEA3_9ACTN|nr:acyl-CoA thioesterase II [Nocardioides gansuensis]PVG84044.1 acyl-CoA thioesterase II [Nocardioides gansuensis]
MPSSAKELVDLLVLEDLDVDLYRGRQPQTERQRVFGGQVAAQAVMAAVRSVDAELMMHSLHSYFLRPGDHSVPIIYDVERIRDGRSFSTRRVVARQHGRPIYFLTASFQRPEDGYDHADRMPEVRPPEESMRMPDVVRRLGGEAEAARWDREWSALDARYVGVSGKGMPEDPDHPAQAQLWIRVDGRLDDEPRTHLAAFTFASDLTLLGATLVPHGVSITSPTLMPASLDHSIWFHRPFRADEWWLYDQVSPTAVGGRGLATARVFTQDGTLVATVAQEGLIRRLDGPRRDRV